MVGKWRWLCSDGDGGNIIYVNTRDKIVVPSSALFVPKVRDRIDLIKTYIEPIFR